MDHKTLCKLNDLLATQANCLDTGTTAGNEYMRGMYNGMEVMLASLEAREPAFKDQLLVDGVDGNWMDRGGTVRPPKDPPPAPPKGTCCGTDNG